VDVNQEAGKRGATSILFDTTAAPALESFRVCPLGQLVRHLEQSAKDIGSDTLLTPFSLFFLMPFFPWRQAASYWN
jgi:hypothetical protein